MLNLNDPGGQLDGLLAVFPTGGVNKYGLEKVVIPYIVGPPDRLSFDKLLTLTSDIYC